MTPIDPQSPQARLDAARSAYASAGRAYDLALRADYGATAARRRMHGARNEFRAAVHAMERSVTETETETEVLS